MNRRLIAIAAIVITVLATSTAGDAVPRVVAASNDPLTVVQTMANPLPRQDASMAFDDATQSIVLFGGNVCGSTGCNPSNDTWTWNGAAWTAQHPVTAPPARMGASMAYDPVSRTVLLFGGQVCDNTGCYWANDTWAWNGRNWNALVPPPPRPTVTVTPRATVQPTSTSTPIGTATSFPPTPTPPATPIPVS